MMFQQEEPLAEPSETFREKALEMFSGIKRRVAAYQPPPLAHCPTCGTCGRRALVRTGRITGLSICSHPRTPECKKERVHIAADSPEDAERHFAEETKL